MGDLETKLAALDYVRKRLRGPDAEYRVVTSSFHFKGQSMPVAELASYWSTETPFSVFMLTAALQREGFEIQMQEEERQRKQQEMYEAYPCKDDELRRWLKLLERPDVTRDRHEASVFVMKQWLWQVKQAIAKRKARWQVCPIFWSREQGTGKSYNVLRILEPIKAFTRHLSVDSLDDNFNGKMLANTYAAFLDEFAGAEQVNAGKLKAVMSGREIQQRAMHSQFGMAIENRISFIATSNETPPHGLEDPTGARRLWSIHCNGSSMQLDPKRRDAFDALDVGKIYASVRTDDPCPHEAADPKLLAFMDRVREDDLRTKTSLETFVNEMCSRQANAEPITLKEFRDKVAEYARQTKQPLLKGPYGKFATALQNLGIKVVRPNGYWYIHGIYVREQQEH